MFETSIAVYVIELKQEKEPKQHDCHKNWTGASSSMEPDIIISGFKEAESKHVLRYTEFVGDGDCSVYPKLITGVLFWLFFLLQLDHIYCNTCFEHQDKAVSLFSFQLFANSGFGVIGVFVWPFRPTGIDYNTHGRHYTLRHTWWCIRASLTLLTLLCHELQIKKVAH